MRLLFIVNDLRELIPKMSTTMLVAAALRDGHEVWISGVADLSLDNAGEVRTRGTRLERSRQVSAARIPRALAETPRGEAAVTSFDQVLIRANPARPPGPAFHRGALGMLALASLEGARVVNDANALLRWGDKRNLFLLPPHVRPETRIGATRERVLEHAAALGERIVIKPVDGTRGQGVFVFGAERGNLGAAVEMLLQAGPVMVQSYAPGAERGDVRVLVAHGAPVEVDGKLVAVARTPTPGETRSNLHAGGTPGLAVLDDGQRKAVREIAEFLHARGITYAGVDLIGALAIEVNVSAPGALLASDKINGIDSSLGVLRAILA